MNISQESIQKFNEIKEKGETLYKTIGEVYCPYFKEHITFNSKGLEHLKFKSRNYARSKDDQYIRFKILQYAPDILKITKTIQGISEQKIFELYKGNNKNEHILVEATFYEFIAIMDKVRVRVVVKQVRNNPKYFWSVIPFWKNNKMGGRRFHYGNPEYD
jgi:hypothetical protein